MNAEEAESLRASLRRAETQAWATRRAAADEAWAIYNKAERELSGAEREAAGARREEAIARAKEVFLETLRQIFEAGNLLSGDQASG